MSPLRARVRLRAERSGATSPKLAWKLAGERRRVEKRRLVLDEPTTLPDGTVVDLVADDEGDDLSDEQRRVLHEALSASWKSAEADRLRAASAILDELRGRS